jgi:ADP-ribose pyrophosphatase YjhB (NUDIX family)
VIFRGDGRVLLIQRGNPPRPGSWSLPGGKVEAGESPETAVTREVLEETGLVVEAVRLVTTVTLPHGDVVYEIHELLCVLAASSRADDAQAGDDARAVRWCTDAEAVALGATPEVLRVIADARSSRP